MCGQPGACQRVGACLIWPESMAGVGSVCRRSRYDAISSILISVGMRISKKAKAEAIAKILERLYPTVPVPLDHKDAYTLLVAVILSGCGCVNPHTAGVYSPLYFVGLASR